MPPIPVRNLAKLGIVKDREPWDLPPEAWSGGRNVRFEDGKAMRASIFREFVPDVVDSSPNLVDVAGLCSYRPSSGSDTVIILDSYGRANIVASGVTLADITETSGFTANQGVGPQYTYCTLAGVLYVNRDDLKPRILTPTANRLVTLPNMDSAWTAGVLRGFKDVLVAFNVTKSGVNYDSMVKWSDIASGGSAPASWDTTDPTKLAGENQPPEMRSIVDANNLRDVMMIYTDRQIWSMEYTGEKTFVFRFRKLWEDEKFGAIARNCSIEIDGMHYVFGSGDIYAHDGVRPPQSICEGLVRRHIYSSMVPSEKSKFFVAHNPPTAEVMFCYVSRDPEAALPGSTYCNTAAVFNYRSRSWSFVDLPNSAAAAVGNAELPSIWSDLPSTSTWANTGGTWADLLDLTKPSMMLVGAASAGVLTAHRLYVADPIQKNSRVALPASSEANPAAFMELVGLDLDMVGASVGTFKRIRTIHPQARLHVGPPPTIKVGAGEYPADDPSYESPVPFDPATTKRVPSRASGRYLSIRVDIPPETDFDFTGFDLDAVPGGRRG